MKYDAIVIGGGVNGLVTAAYLGKAGRRVLVCERRAALGGVCTTEEFHSGFRADICIDDAGWVPPQVEQDLELARHGYSSTFAPVSAVAPLPDGEPLALHGDVRRTADALRRVSPADAGKWQSFTKFVARLAGFLEALYSTRSPVVESNAPADLMTLLALGRRMRGLGRRGMIDVIRSVPMPVADLLDEWFENETLKAALATAGVEYVQHGPYSGGTALLFLHRHVGMAAGYLAGRRITRGGVGKLPEALAAAARAAGVELRTGAEVVQVLVKDGRAVGVVLANGDTIDADAVVSDLDPRRTFATLVDPGDFDPEFLHAVDHVRMRGSTARVFLALAGLPAFQPGGTRWPEELLHGTIILSPTVESLERAYDDAKHRREPRAPAIRATIPTLAEPGLAPAGRHVLTAHVQYAAHDVDGGWTAERRAALGDLVVERLAAVAPDLPALIEHREVVLPPDLEDEFGVTEGSLLHGELALDQFLFMRPVPAAPRYATPLAGLWLCGSGTHPGAGTAGASGRLAATHILQDGKRKR